jgi:hypothetical protein
MVAQLHEYAVLLLSGFVFRVGKRRCRRLNDRNCVLLSVHGPNSRSAEFAIVDVPQNDRCYRSYAEREKKKAETGASIHSNGLLSG